MNIKILYGVNIMSAIDITHICLEKMNHCGIIKIPKNIPYLPNGLFTKPFFGQIKKVFIIRHEQILDAGDYIEILINTLNDDISIITPHTIQKFMHDSTKNDDEQKTEEKTQVEHIKCIDDNDEICFIDGLIKTVNDVKQVQKSDDDMKREEIKKYITIVKKK